MTFIEVIYVGLFVLPLAAAALVALGHLARSHSEAGWMLLAGWTSVLVVGVIVFAGYGRAIPPMPRMPYIPQYLGPPGLGPADLHGGRRWLVGWEMLDWATAACAVASFVFALALCRRAARPRRPDATRLGAGIVLSIALWQMVGVLPPSFHFRNWIVSVDRYLLPLLPLGLCLMLWALRGVRLATPVAWVVVLGGGLFAVAGTRDFLVLQEATWSLARAATELGVPLTRLDGGASWDGYHLYEYSQALGIAQQTPGGPWWTHLFGPATNSDYVVTTAPLAGYDVLGQVPYSSWLEDDPTTLYLVRRQGMAGLP
jgi:hypothetical protein